MRFLAGAILLSCGCQLLPHTELSCSGTDRCPPVPDMNQPMDMSTSAPTTVKSAFVLGQPNPQTNWLLLGFSAPKGVTILPGGKLAVADQDNNRVLIWNTFPTKNQQPPDVVIGQPNFSVGDDLYGDPNGLRQPGRMTTDGVNLIISADNGTTTSTQPLTFFNSIPTTNFANFSFQINPGASPVAGPRTFVGASPLVATGKLFLVNRQFNRVLIWNTVPTNGTTDASLVLGQTNFTSATVNAGGLSPSSMNLPDGTPAVDGGKLFVPDTANNRVLLWNTLPTANGQAASLVLGQSSTTANLPNRGGTVSLGGMDSPSGIAAANGRLVVADRYNHRVLLWNSLPTSTGQPADLVLGQTTGTSGGSNSGGVSARGMGEPLGVATDGTKVVVADTYNYRVLIWNSWPTANGAPADVVLGQPDFSNSSTSGSVVSDSLMGAPMSVTRSDNRLLVLDGRGSRVLIWPQLPLDASAKPTIVLGQPSMTTMGDNVAGVSSRSLNQPRDMFSNGTTLAVADTYNNRVLIWNTIPSQTFQASNIVLGQSGFSSNGINVGGASLGMNDPRGVFIHNNRVFVSDTGNHRILIWSTMPTANQAAPDIVLGQSDLTKITSNRGQTAPDASTLSGPRGVFVDDTRIYVADEGNSRILIWNTSTPKTGQAADLVLGAKDFVSAGSFSAMRGLHVAGTRLYAAEIDNHRILVWNTLPTQNNQFATSAIGQPSVLSSVPNVGGIGLSGLQSPYGVLDTEAALYIADYGNGRVVVLPPVR